MTNRLMVALYSTSDVKYLAARAQEELLLLNDGHDHMSGEIEQRLQLVLDLVTVGLLKLQDSKDD